MRTKKANTDAPTAPFISEELDKGAGESDSSNQENKRRIAPAVLLAVFLVFAGIAVYFYNESRTLSNDPAAQEQKEMEQIVQSLGKHFILPEGETPTVATVIDTEKLKDDPFLSKAKLGDKVVFYSKSGKVFLYDPSADRIIDVGKITIGE